MDKPSVVPDTSIRENSERMDMLATPAECRNCIKKHPLNTPGPCRLPERCCSKDAALGKPSRALCCCSCSWLSSHEGIVLPRLSCLEDKGGQPARFILGSVYGSPTDTLLALACRFHVWPQPISTISKSPFHDFFV